MRRPYQGAAAPTSRASSSACGSIRLSASSAARPRLTTQRRIEQVDQRPQVVRAVAKLAGARAVVPAVRLARVAEHGVRDEDAAPLDAGARQERVEVAAGLVAAQRDARAVRAQPARRLRHEQHPGVHRPVPRPERPGPSLHPRAPPARLRRLHQLQKARRCAQPAPPLPRRGMIGGVDVAPRSGSGGEGLRPALTSGTPRTSSAGSARSAPPRCPAPAPSACRPGRSRRRPRAAPC